MNEKFKTNKGDREELFWKIRVRHWVNQLTDFCCTTHDNKKRKKSLEQGVVWETFDPSELNTEIKSKNLETV